MLTTISHHQCQAAPPTLPMSAVSVCVCVFLFVVYQYFGDNTTVQQGVLTSNRLI